MEDMYFLLRNLLIPAVTIWKLLWEFISENMSCNIRGHLFSPMAYVREDLVSLHFEVWNYSWWSLRGTNKDRQQYMVDMCAEACFGIPKNALRENWYGMIGDESMLEILKGCWEIKQIKKTKLSS